MSNKVVVDTSIVIKWVIDETGSNIAVALLARWISEGLIILAPSLLAYEITNVLHQQNNLESGPCPEGRSIGHVRGKPAPTALSIIF
jgi:predicted nucleic acid-binding protein